MIRNRVHSDRNGIVMVTIGHPGGYYVYKVKDCAYPGVYYVLVRIGADTYKNYIYIGAIVGGFFKLTRMSKLRSSRPEVKVFARAFGYLCGKSSLPEGFNVHYRTRCKYCGKRLTTPKSIKLGYGPICRKRYIHSNERRITNG